MLRRLLATLLVNLNRPVTTDALIAALWGDVAPPGCRKTIQVYMHRLREAIGNRDPIHQEAGGYRLILSADALDAAQFDRLASKGRKLRGDDRQREAADVFAQALALWRGSAYADMDEHPLIADEAHRLEEERISVIFDYTETRLGLGHHEDLIPELISSAELYPYNEDLRRHLMIALYRSGRQAEALEVFQKTHKLLADELGLTPGPELRRLQESVLRNDPELELGSAPVWSTQIPHELPPALSRFAGRIEQLSAMDRAAASADWGQTAASVGCVRLGCVIQLVLDFVLYALSGAFAWITGGSSTLAPHRSWGEWAVWGYAAAAVLVWVTRSVRARLWLTVGAWVAVAWVPLLALAHANRGQEEVFVVEESARRMLGTGTPYLDRAELAALPEPLLGYTPYQPGMAIFGFPRALFGEAWWTDARLYFALFTAVALAYAVSLLELDGKLVRAVQMATVLPLCALTLATGGDDIPVLALCLLAFTLAYKGKLGWAGVAIGAAAAMKLFAWPVLLVLAIFARRARFAVPAMIMPLMILLPSILLDPSAVVENVIRFPTGHGLVTSPAASPLVGYLIANAFEGGRLVALGLLGAAGLAIAVYLWRRPPQDMRTVVNVCAIGLVVAILLMPATRFGYLLYPVAFAFWAPTLRGRATPG